MEKDILVKKGKKGLFKIIFGRTGVVFCLLLIQLAILFSGFVYLKEYFAYILGGFTLLSTATVIYILNEKIDPSFQLVWVVPVLLLPVFGCLLYIFVQLQIGTKYIAARLRALEEQTKPYLQQEKQAADHLKETDMDMARLCSYLGSAAGAPVYQNTEVTYFPLGENKFEEMKKQLMLAEKFIFMEYFIVEEGHMFGKILEILKRKAAQGLDVRFIYDDFGCVTTLPEKYYLKMQGWGIQCVRFNPLYPVMSVIMNNRDHRKILVADGKVGFTGGINLADEYINKVKRFGYWKDTGIRLEGEGVWSFTVMFLEMWDYITKAKERDLSQFFPSRYQTRPFQSDGYVQPYTDSPLDHENVGENIYMNIINRAKKYVYIFTPYLIPDDEILKALQNTAKSGVDVRILMPGIPDKRIVYWISQSYYEPLLECGVRIYQYNPGFLHAKCFVCDDEVAVVGSVNLDYRSLYLHFECGVWMYRSKAVMQVKEDMAATMGESEEINMDFCHKRPAAIRTLQGVMRLFAPLL